MTAPTTLLRNVLDALPLQLAVLDEEGVIQYTNRAWQRFGLDNGLVGDPGMLGENYLAVCDATDDEDATAVAAGIRAVLAGERDEFAHEYPCHSPEERRWFLMRAVPFETDDDRHVLVVHLDITGRKLAELSVRERNDQLDALAGVLAHDLRNPLSVAIGRAQLLAEDGVETGAIQDSLVRIDDIVDDALLLARGSDVGDLETVDLETVAEEAWGHVDAERARLVVADSFAFEADRSLLSQLFENLFRNAVEHGARRASGRSAPGDAVEHGSTSPRSRTHEDAVEHAAPDDGGELTVTVGRTDAGFYVADDGPGIPPDDRDAVFDPGYTTHEAGTGLGLAIVARVAGAHGWSVELVESETGGARFEVSGVQARGDADA